MPEGNLESRAVKSSWFTKVVPPVTGVLVVVALLPKVLYSHPERELPTIQDNLKSSYEQCLQYGDKELRRKLPIGVYSCQEVEDLYLKVSDSN